VLANVCYLATEMSQARVALITGAGRGIGRAEALFLASRGYWLVVNDWDASPGSGAEQPVADAVVAEIRAAGGDAVADYGDVASTDGANSMVERAVEQFGRLDVLVNNAGIIPRSPFVDMPVDDWNEVIRVNLGGHVAASRAATKWWSENAEPSTNRRIINTTSLAGLYGAVTPTAAYATAKAGILGLTWSLSRELAGMNVTVNAIAPRALTRMTEANPKLNDGRFGADRVAPLVGWLASEGAANITGRTFVVAMGQYWVARPIDVAGPYALDDNDEHFASVLDQLPDTAIPTGPEIATRFG
jgi:NAD(P)-dependent dehydrogenase (short-subunit alcohol dehydrogenase family)